MLENKSFTVIKKSSERNFGIVFCIIFLIISFYPLLHGGSVKYWSLYISIILLIISIFFQYILKYPNHIWYKFGNLLSSIISPLVMILIFYFIVTPIGLMMRVLNKDLLNNKINQSLKTYWIKRKKSNDSMKNQF